MTERILMPWEIIPVLEKRIKALFKIRDRLFKGKDNEDAYNALTQEIKRLQGLIESLSPGYDD